MIGLIKSSLLVLAFFAHRTQSSLLTINDMEKEYSDDIVLDDSDVNLFPKMLKRMIMEDRFPKETRDRMRAAFNRYGAVDGSDPIFNTTRKCGDLISRMPVENVRSVSLQLMNVAVPEGTIGGALAKLYVENRLKYGVETYKICSSCSEFYDEYGGGEDVRDHYEYYCGVDKYAHSATFSGILMLPIKEDGSYLEGSLKLSLWMHFNTEMVQECPSMQFPSESDWGDDIIQQMQDQQLNLEALPLGGVSVGSVSLMPDFQGYGESWEYYKNPSLKRSYQAASIPLVIKSKELVPEISGDVTSMNGNVIVTGFSEGCLAAIAAIPALTNVQLRVTYSQVGGGPYDTVSRYGALHTFMYSDAIKKYMPMWASTYSSTNPDLENSNKNQDLLNDDWKDKILNFTRLFDDGLNLDGDEFEAEIANASYHDFTVLDFNNMVYAGFDQKLKHPCDLAEVGKTDLICEALKANDMTYVVENTKEQMMYCWGGGDTAFGNHPCRLKALLNWKLTSIQIPNADHINAGIACSAISWLFFTTPLYHLY